MQVGQEESRVLPDPAESGSDGTSGQRRAFSLIELIVCICVLFILTGIMLPALHSAVRHGGGKMKCQNNLGQLGLALGLYAQDHSDILPECGYFPFRSQNQYAPLAQVMMPYFSGTTRVDFTSLWVCPNDDGVTRLEKPDRSSYVYPPGRRLGRGYRLTMSLFQGPFPLLGDREAYHSPTYNPNLSPGPYMPRVKRDRSEWSDNFEFPDGHNRFRADGAITCTAVGKADTNGQN